MTATLVASEKDEERAGDKLMTMLGFSTLRFSQPRNTMQTPGISDRRYYRPARKSTFPQYENERPLIVWWEAKREGGKQSAHQRAFQQLVESCGEEYVCGPLSALVDWCARKGLVMPTEGR